MRAMHVWGRDVELDALAAMADDWPPDFAEQQLSRPMQRSNGTPPLADWAGRPRGESRVLAKTRG